MQRVLVILILAVLLLGFGAQLANPVGATSHPPSITVSPSSRTPNSTTVTVQGSGFPINTPVTVTFNGTNNYGASADGAGAFSRSFTIPRAPGGSVNITAGGAITTFTVNATANLSSASGSVGDRVTVTGEGFGASQAVAIKFDGNTVVSSNPNANSNGSLSTSFTVPSVSASSYQVSIGILNKTFTVSSSFSVSPQSGPPGTSVQITGSGYLSGANIDLTMDGIPLQPPLQADPSGNLFGTVVIPIVAGGSKTIRVSSGTGQSTFEVTPTLILDQTTTAPGSTINATGTAFRANESGISIKFDTKSVAAAINADSQGRWTASFSVPSSTAGDHTVTASGPSTGTNAPTARLTIGASISLDRNSGPPATQVKINGTGAGSNERIIINVGSGLARAETTANGSGVWTADIVIPSAPRGPLSINATGSNNQTTTVNFNVTSILTLSVPTGPPGFTVVANGEGFGANASGINITFGNAIVTSTSADAQGSWSVNLVIPPSPKGTYTIKAAGVGSDLQALFTVAAGLSINKPQARPGESVTVSGSGFAPNESGITLKLGDKTIATGITANAAGSWNTSFAIPAIPANSYELSASGALTPAGSIQKKTLTLLTHVALTTNSGPPGSTMAITGKGFGANEQGITVSFDGAPILSGIVADSQGAFTSSLVVPAATAGRHTIVVTGSSGIALGSELSFQVVPGLTLTESTGPSSKNIALAGAGFGPNQQNIEVKFGPHIVIPSVSADVNGNFEASFMIPPSAAGQHTVAASGAVGSLSAQAQQTYTVVPHITLSEQAGNVGMSLSVSGTGFSPTSSITLAYDDLTEAAVVTDEAGSFNLQLTVPESIKGSHSVIALDTSGKRVQEIFEIESIPPSAPALRSPGNGDSGALLGKFRPSTRWTPVEDPSGVTYNIQVAADRDFLDILVDRKGLSSPTYNFSKEEALPRGTYYWRVQAVDLASNESSYSPVFEMNSGIVPIWLLSAMVALGIIASGGGAYAFYSRVHLARKTAQEASAYPEFVRISRPEITGPAQGTGATTPPTPALNAPRRALPSPFRRSPARSSVSPEQQAHLQFVVDFVSSIPLLEVSPDLVWMEELIESLGGDQEDIFEQVLRGDVEPVYQPPWMQHPTYQEMQSEPSASVFLEGLENYIEAVNDCATDTLSVLRRIYNDMEAAGSSDVLGRHQWRYAMTVTQSTIAWFRGTYLGQPSAREYTIQTGGDPGNPSLASLYGEENSPFSGVIIEGISEEDLVFYRDLHIQLRNSYRVDENARALAAKMTSTSALRDQLSHNIAQMGESSTGR